MKILHVTFGLPPYANGGLPLYVEGLVSMQEKMGDEPIVLEPGAMSGKVGIRRVHTSRHRIFRVTPALPVAYTFGVNEPAPYMRPINKEVYEKFLEKIQPEMIHIHSLMGIHKELFEVAKDKNIKVVMTTHDYYGLDLRTNFVDIEGKIYNDRDPRMVAKRNYQLGASSRKQKIIQTSLYKKIKNSRVVKIIRRAERGKVMTKRLQPELTDKIISEYAELLRYYDRIFGQIDYFLYNSTVTEKIYQKFINGKGEILHLMLPGLERARHEYKTKDVIRVGFIGRKEKYKGSEILAEATRGMDGVEVFLYGDDFSNIAGQNVYNAGRFSREELSSILKEFDLLVMPSVWYETFAFPVLEALMAGIPVLVSSRVGAKDLITDAPVDATFEPEVQALKTVLEKILEKDNLKKYTEWVAGLKFPTMEEHTSKIKNIYKKVLEQ